MIGMGEHIDRLHNLEVIVLFYEERQVSGQGSRVAGDIDYSFRRQSRYTGDGGRQPWRGGSRMIVSGAGPLLAILTRIFSTLPLLNAVLLLLLISAFSLAAVTAVLFSSMPVTSL